MCFWPRGVAQDAVIGIGAVGHRRARLLAGFVAALTLISVSVSAVPETASAAIPGSQLWVSRYETRRQEGANAMATSPDGMSVFVTGSRFSKKRAMTG